MDPRRLKARLTPRSPKTWRIASRLMPVMHSTSVGTPPGAWRRIERLVARSGLSVADMKRRHQAPRSTFGCLRAFSG